MKTVCRVCPLECALREGQKGRCGVRSNQGGLICYDLYGMVYPLYLAPTEIHFNHLLPGSLALATGSLGCNLGCRMCHNSFQTQDIQQHAHNLMEFEANELVDLADQQGAEVIVFTYNDPVPQYEWIIDVASACRKSGLLVALCTAGYISREYRAALFNAVDAVELSLKGFSWDTHHRMTGVSSTSPLESIQFLAQSDTWLEVTITVVPGYNDDMAELTDYVRWHLQHLGADVPLRFAGFRPEHELKDVEPTSEGTLGQLQAMAEAEGLDHVYLGNVNYPPGQTTFCHKCGTALIERDWFRLVSYDAIRDTCPNCDAKIPGIFKHDHPVQRFHGKQRIIEVPAPCVSSE